MAAIDISIDIGSSYTTIFMSGNGIVLKEPTLIAFYDDGRTSRTRAVGYEAVDMLGKAPERTKVVQPVRDGIIVNAEACSYMLKVFIQKLLPDSYVVRPKLRAIVGVPIGISKEQLRIYELVVRAAGVDQLVMVGHVILAALGTGLDVRDSFGGFMVTLGGGCTEIAAISLCSILKGCAFEVGGSAIDTAISDSLLGGMHHIRVGLNTARRIKTSVGSLLSQDNAEIKVSGTDCNKGTISEVTVTSRDIYAVLTEYHDRIIKVILRIINSCPPETAAEIQREGIWIAGGGSKLIGLQEYYENALDLDVHIAEKAEFVTALGGGKLLNDAPLLSDITLHY